MDKKIKQLIKDKLRVAKINEAYHRKQMEYYQEEIKILEFNLKDLK